MDTVIFDAFNHPLLLPKYELFPIEGTLAVIQVKSNLDKRQLISAFENIASAKRLESEEAKAVWVAPVQVYLEGEAEPYALSDMPAPLGIVFAFESSLTAKTILEHWSTWNAAQGVYS